MFVSPCFLYLPTNNVAPPSLALGNLKGRCAEASLLGRFVPELWPGGTSEQLGGFIGPKPPGGLASLATAASSQKFTLCGLGCVLDV